MAIGGLSIYRASVDGFYRQVNLNENDSNYLGEVEDLKIEADGYRCGKVGLKSTAVEKLKCGERLLAEGKVRRGVYELTKGMKAGELEVRLGKLKPVEWEQMKSILREVLGLVKGGVYEALEKEFKFLNEVVKESYGWQ